MNKISDFVGPGPDTLAVTVASKKNDPFAVLISTILSLRTRDEVCAIVTPRFLDSCPDPISTIQKTESEISELIYPTSFYRMKSRYILDISRNLIDRFDSKVPSTMDELLSLKGIGRKSANLILNLAFNIDSVCVDSHVHRLSNRIGFVQTKTPNQTELALMRVLPESLWIPINGILISFGRTHCTPLYPKCSSCPISSSCEKNGVLKSR